MEETTNFMYSQRGQFTLRFDDQSIIISLATARSRCPAECAAMDAAGVQVRAARVHGAQPAIDVAVHVHQDRMRDLARALRMHVR